MKTLHEIWLDAWIDAVAATWPGPKPAAVIQLEKIVERDLPYTPPEAPQRTVQKAWMVFVDEGDTPEGRAAVALAHVIGLMAERRSA